MWALATYFNPVRYKRRLANYRIFRSNLNIPLVVVELAFDGDFELTRNDADVLVQISGGAVLWQKERLLNIALKSVPSDVKNIAWLDCDVLFKRNDWAEEAARLLDAQYSVVQLFSRAVYLNKEDTKAPLADSFDGYRTSPGLVAVYDETNRSLLDKNPTGRGDGSITYIPGLAWAARKDVLLKHGFYDLGIVGSGDMLLASAIYGRMDSLIEFYDLNKATSERFLRWAKPLNQTVGGKVGHVPGEIFHLWHGDLANRNYRNRIKILADYDPEADVYIGDNGAWHWTKPDSALAERVRAYFLDRREDG